MALGSLLSLPLPLDLLSLVLVPSAVSYTTSANLLFFYVNWVSLIFTHPPLRLEIVGTLLVKVALYLVPSWLFWVLAVLRFHVLGGGDEAQIKGIGAGATEQSKAPSQQHGEKQARPRTRLALVGSANVLVGLMVQTVLGIVMGHGLQWERRIRTSIMLPLPWEIATGLLKALALREAIGYLAHRCLLHSHFITPWLARRHRAWYHTLRELGPFAATYDHPACYIVNRFLPAYLAAVLLRLHLITYMLYMALVSSEEMLAYCDFSFVSSGHLFLVVGAIGRQAKRHLDSGGRSHFGDLGVVDWLCGGRGDATAPSTAAATTPAQVTSASGARPSRTRRHDRDRDRDEEVVEVSIDDLSDAVKQRVRARTAEQRRRSSRLAAAARKHHPSAARRKDLPYDDAIGLYLD
ncbi:hypothetical protein KEM52_004066 [Ascosphaera acerosa]|nr:hypothetical protein KEM52_004066 [Ascosphaera acerosa]